MAQRHVEWVPGRVMNAICVGGGHPAPSVGCWCGISGARDMDALRQHGLCVLPGALVVGEVDLWGRVLLESYGYRAEHARPASLGLVEGTAGTDADLDRVRAALEAYDVPVRMVPLDEAVAGTTAQMLTFQMMSRGTYGTCG